MEVVISTGVANDFNKAEKIINNRTPQQDTALRRAFPVHSYAELYEQMCKCGLTKQDYETFMYGVEGDCGAIYTAAFLLHYT